MADAAPVTALPSPAPAAVNTGLITVGVMLGTMVSVLGTSTINVALADIMKGVGADLHTIDWVITGFMLAMVITMPLTGWLDARLGKRNLYLGGLAVFTLASMACGLAWDMPSLIAFRLVQGLGGGVMMPTAQAILFETYPPEKRGMAMGIFGMGAILGPAFGPTVGGWLVQLFGWRSLFYLNVPFAILAFVLLRAALPIKQGAGGRAFDAKGFVLLSVALVSLQVGVGDAGRTGWSSPGTLVLLGVAVVAGAVFMWSQLHNPAPLVVLRVFQHGIFSRGVLVSSVMGAALYGGAFLVPLFLGSVMHMQAMDIGLLMMPGSLVMGVFMLLSGRMSSFVEARVLVTGGLVVMAISTWVMGSLTPENAAPVVLWALVARGVGLGVAFAPLSVVTLGALEPSQVAGGSGLYNLTRQLAGAIGIALIKSLVTWRKEVHASEPGVAAAAALTHAFDDAFVVTAVVVAVCVAAAVTLAPKRVPALV